MYMVSFLFLFHVKGLHREEEVDLLKERGKSSDFTSILFTCW